MDCSFSDVPLMLCLPLLGYVAGYLHGNHGPVRQVVETPAESVDAGPVPGLDATPPTPQNDTDNGVPLARLRPRKQTPTLYNVVMYENQGKDKKLHCKPDCAGLILLLVQVFLTGP